MAGLDHGGQTMGHDEYREWAEVALGDPRQVYAKEADAPPGHPLVFMPDGEALQFRKAAKSGVLICPVPGCPSPRLTTRSSEEKRDHFMHLVSPAGKKHGLRYLGLSTQRLLRGWAEGQRHVVEVIEDVEVDGIPILLLARMDDGRKVALCYVNKRFGADAWEEQNRTLRSGGLAVAWIFALQKTYFAPPDPAEAVAPVRTDLILDRRIYKRMREKGSWPLLINLERQKLANVFKPDGGPAQRLRIVPPDLDRVQHFKAYGLGECRLCPYGIATPAIKERTLELTNDNWRR